LQEPPSRQLTVQSPSQVTSQELEPSHWATAPWPMVMRQLPSLHETLQAAPQVTSQRATPVQVAAQPSPQESAQRGFSREHWRTHPLSHECSQEAPLGQSQTFALVLQG
jgi:hypothetical protein